MGLPGYCDRQFDSSSASCAKAFEGGSLFEPYDRVRKYICTVADAVRIYVLDLAVSRPIATIYLRDRAGCFERGQGHWRERLRGRRSKARAPKSVLAACVARSIAHRRRASPLRRPNAQTSGGLMSRARRKVEGAHVNVPEPVEDRLGQTLANPPLPHGPMRALPQVNQLAALSGQGMSRGAGLRRRRRAKSVRASRECIDPAKQYHLRRTPGHAHPTRKLWAAVRGRSLIRLSCVKRGSAPWPSCMSDWTSRTPPPQSA